MTDPIRLLDPDEQLFVEGMQINSDAMCVLTLSLQAGDDGWRVAVTTGPTGAAGMLFYRYAGSLSRPYDWYPVDDSVENRGIWRRRVSRPSIPVCCN